MRILVLGGTGFIGRHVVAELVGAGHSVTLAVRDQARAARVFPALTLLLCDLNRDTRPEDWRPRLVGIEAVVNCAGILQGGRRQDIAAIHRDAPIALFRACVEADVSRVVQVSALGAEPAAGTAYAVTKHAADEALLALPLDAVVVQPSLAYLTGGSYGGTSLFRALAACPFVVPLPGRGEQLFQPIAVPDLVQGIRRLVEAPQLERCLVQAVGPEPIALKDLLFSWRRWLGLRPAPGLSLPLWLLRLAARLGDLFGTGPITTTSLRMLLYGNAAPAEGFVAATGIRPKGMAEVLAAAPAHAQDRWHARLSLLRPLSRTLLASLWIATGVATLLSSPAVEAAFAALPLPSGWLRPLVLAGGTWDLVLGALLLFGLARRPVLMAMLATLLGYAAALLFWFPQSWTTPLLPAGLLLPFALVTLVQAVLEDDR